MAKLTPTQVADKWVRNTSAATQYLQTGVMAVVENPATKAIAAKQKMRTRLLDSIDNGKWEQGLGRVTLASWQKAMIEKGLPRISQGVTSAQPKFQKFMTELLPYQDTLAQSVKAMPDLTLQDSIQRMIAWTQGMANFKRSG